MSKSMNERLERLVAKRTRAQEALDSVRQEEDGIVLPICEKVTGILRAKLEEALRADVSKAAMIDFSKDALKASIDGFVASLIAPKDAPRRKPAIQTEEPKKPLPDPVPQVA